MSSNTFPQGGGARRRSALTAAILAGALSLAAAARAETSFTESGTDFLQQFTDAHPAAANPDLNVIAGSAVFDSANFRLTAQMAGTIGQTPGGLYVWGVDRGQGIEFFQTLPNPTGQGVSFDTFIALNTDGTGLLVNDFFDPTKAQKIDLAPGAISILGDTISVLVPLADLPSNGFDPSQFGFNIWPRLGGISSNDQIADFGPDNHNITAASVPEPASWALMILGVAAAGAVLRRRRGALPAI
jgi:hypothetical protein